MHGGLKAVTPLHVLALVWVANVIGAVVLLVEYLVVLPFPDEVSTTEIVRDNVVIGLVCIVASWLVLGAVGGPRTKRALAWTRHGTVPTPEERELTLNLPWWLFGCRRSPGLPRAWCSSRQPRHRHPLRVADGRRGVRRWQRDRRDVVPAHDAAVPPGHRTGARGGAARARLGRRGRREGGVHLAAHHRRADARADLDGGVRRPVRRTAAQARGQRRRRRRRRARHRLVCHRALREVGR